MAPQMPQQASFCSGECEKERACQVVQNSPFSLSTALRHRRHGPFVERSRAVKRSSPPCCRSFTLRPMGGDLFSHISSPDAHEEGRGKSRPHTMEGGATAGLISSKQKVSSGVPVPFPLQRHWLPSSLLLCASLGYMYFFLFVF